MPLCQVAGNPEPEGGAYAHVTGHANLSATSLNDGLANGEAEACSLDKVVELDETLEHGGLLVLGDAGTRILTIEVESVDALALLLAIADADVALAGVLDGIGDYGKEFDE